MQRREEKPPICKCHELPKVWESDSRRAKGGFWRCCVRLRDKRYRDNNSLPGYIRKRKYELRKSKELTLKRLKELLNVR